MLFAGTFTGFVEGFVKASGVVNFSLWAKRLSSRPKITTVPSVTLSPVPLNAG